MAHPHERRRALLQKVPLFAGLAPEQLEALAAATVTRRLAAREELFHKGDAAAQVYVVASGRLKVVTSSSEGDDALLAIVDEGEVVGELPMLTGGRRMASVVALEPCELLALARRDFLHFLRAHPEAAIELMVVLAERLVRVSEFVEDTLFLALSARIAKKLLHLAERYGEPTADGSATRIALRLSQSELAELVGTTRESVNKQLRAWAEQGIVRMERGEVTILDGARLEGLAGLVAT